MTDQILYFKCKRCNHESMLRAELMNKVLTNIPRATIQPGILYQDQNGHRCKCSKCSNKNRESVLGTEKNEGISTSPDLNQDVYCGSCGGAIEEERLRILPDTNVCGNCAQSVINIVTEEDSDRDHKSCRLCNSVMVLILPHIDEHRVKPHL